MAKLADYIGRGETYIVVTAMYCIGYILYASANNIEQIAGGQIIYSSVRLPPLGSARADVPRILTQLPPPSRKRSASATPVSRS